VIGGPKRNGRGTLKDGHPAPFPLECVESVTKTVRQVGSYEGVHSVLRRDQSEVSQIQVISSSGIKVGPAGGCRRHRRSLLLGEVDMMSLATQYDNHDRKGPKSS